MGIEWSTADLILAAALAVIFCMVVHILRSRTGGAVKTTETKAPAAVLVPAPIVAVDSGIDEETVAAIMAAVYSCLGEADSGVRYAVKSIARAQSGRPVWGFAGMQQNTRPF